MLIFCPTCQRQLRVPDEAAGRRVKCPGCQTAFLVGGNAPPEQIQAPPAPRPAAPPEEEDDESFEPRRPRRLRIDLDEEDISTGDDEARQRAGAAALWFYIAAGLTLGVALINIIMAISEGELVPGAFARRHEREAFLAGMICGIFGCGGVFAAINVLIIVAGMQLKRFTAKGWVITGIVLMFVQTLFFTGGTLLNVFVLVTDLQEALDHWAPLTVLLSGSAAGLNCFAGIRGILALNNQAVSREFKRRAAPRRRRRRD